MDRPTESDVTRPSQSTWKQTLLRIGFQIAFWGSVALAAPFVLPALTPYGLQPPLLQQVIQSPTAHLDGSFLTWGVIAALLLVLSGTQTFRRSPATTSFLVGMIGLMVGLALFVPSAGNLIADLRASHVLRLHDSTDWLWYVGMLLIVVGNLAVVIASWVTAWSVLSGASPSAP